MTNCICNSSLVLDFFPVNIAILNSTIRGGEMTLRACNVEINGTFLFSTTSQGLNPSNPLATCMFLSSNVTITGDVTFANDVRRVIFVYLSTITLSSGNILFVNNSGVSGGAMALYSSTLNIAPNTSVYFYNNTATETGGAIYVGNEGNTDLPLPILPCFYQLLNYDVNSSNWYNISFHDNSAMEGGDHIYGAFMHSGDCYVDPAHKVVASCCAQRYFHYDPKSQSSVSSDPMRVCICKNGSQQRTKSYSNIDITVHPGETFTLSVVVVRADFGTILGSVHVIFENSEIIVQLKPSSQYIQGILTINDDVCSELNFILFSE